MRGKVPKIEDGIDFIGITPAYAGKRTLMYPFSFEYWDHPRLCGEKKCCAILEIVSMGSPPPMRGKVRLLYHRGELFRITPAYAGKSCLRPKVERNHRDHPRLCGEKFRND